MNRLQEILDKACLVCGRANRFHRVFWSPQFNGYQRQMIDDWLASEPLVPSHDHYAIIDNLEYLEYKENQKRVGL